MGRWVRENPQQKDQPLVLQENHYYPFGMSMGAELNRYTNQDAENKYKYNSKELTSDFDLNWSDYGARWYDGSVGRWTTVDPLAAKYSFQSPYAYATNNPVLFRDILGMGVEGEFEWDKQNKKWKKVSTKGDAIGVDFYHFDGATQFTYVTDRQGNWNTISNGRYALQGDLRSGKVGPGQIFDEFLSGTGPERSVFEGGHSANYSIRHNPLYRSAFSMFKQSGKTKGRAKLNFRYGWDNLKVGFDGQGQMMGSFNVSFYRLGSKILSLAQDSKSRTSYYYHLPVTNYLRSDFRIRQVGCPGCCARCGITKESFEQDRSESNTYQTYLFFN